jgi:hypothetical protein
MLRDCRVIRPPPIEFFISLKDCLVISLATPPLTTTLKFVTDIDNFRGRVRTYGFDRVGIRVPDPLPRSLPWDKRDWLVPPRDLRLATSPP